MQVRTASACARRGGLLAQVVRAPEQPSGTHGVCPLPPDAAVPVCLILERISACPARWGPSGRFCDVGSRRGSLTCSEDASRSDPPRRSGR